MTRREREAPEIGAMSRRVFRSLVRRAGDGDVEALRELVALQSDLRNAITDAGRAMHDEAGFTYTYLAAETGVTRQAALKRYGPVRCLRCNCVIFYDSGDLAWRSITADGLICEWGQDEDGNDAVGHVGPPRDRVGSTA
jgi:hypothetical protein